MPVGATLGLAAGTAATKVLPTAVGFAAEELSAAGRAIRDQIKTIQSKFASGESLGFTDLEKREMLGKIAQLLEAAEKSGAAEVLRGVRGGGRSGMAAVALGEMAKQRQAALAEAAGSIEKSSAEAASKTYRDYLDTLKERTARFGQVGGAGGEALVTGVGAGIAGYQKKRKEAAGEETGGYLTNSEDWRGISFDPQASSIKKS